MLQASGQGQRASSPPRCAMGPKGAGRPRGAGVQPRRPPCPRHTGVAVRGGGSWLVTDSPDQRGLLAQASFLFVSRVHPGGHWPLLMLLTTVPRLMGAALLQVTRGPALNTVLGRSSAHSSLFQESHRQSSLT